MTSPTLDSTEKLNLENWSPSKKYYLVPTLVFPCGDAARFKELRRAVDQRLEQFVADGVIRWAPTLNPSEPIQKDQIVSEIVPLLAHALWQRLLDKGYVDAFPDVDHPMQLQFLVVCDLSGAVSRDTFADWLSKLASAIESTKVGDRAMYSLSLLVLGDPDMDLDKLQAYWPRFYLGSTAWGGTQVAPEHAWQVCQNVIVTLAASEFGRFMDDAVSKDRKSAGWIALGASAILVDLSAIKNRFTPEVLNEFIKPLVKASPDEAQQRLLDDAAEEKRRELQGTLLGEAAKVAKNAGWDIAVVEYKPEPEKKWPEQRRPEPQVSRDKHQRQGCYLAFESDLARTIFGDGIFWWLDERDEEPYIPRTWRFYEKWWGWLKFGWRRFKDLFPRIPLPKYQGLETLLAENYHKLDADLRRELNGPANQKYQDLVDTLAFLLDRRGYAGEQLPLASNMQWPAGLQAVRYEVGAMVDRLTRSPLFMYAGQAIQPAPPGGRNYWVAAARADLSVIEGVVRRYERFHRRIFSPWGMLLRLTVAWPLLTGLLEILTNWNPTANLLASTGVLVLLGLLELTYWRVKDRRLLMWARSQINNCLASRVLAMVARSIQDYRLRVAAKLPPIQRVLTELTSALEEENQQMRRECERRAEQAGNREEGTLYWLVDYEQALGTETVGVTTKAMEERGKEKEWQFLEGEYAHFYVDDSSRSWLSWRSEARRNANVEASQNSNGKFDKFETDFLAKHAFPLLERSKSIPAIVEAFKEKSQSYVQSTIESHRNSLESYALADKETPLKDGVKWRWLYQRSHPLGGDVKGYSLITVIIVPGKEPLSGATGEESEHWPKNSSVVTSRQVSEIGCLRGVIEWI